MSITTRPPFIPVEVPDVLKLYGLNTIPGDDLLFVPYLRRTVNRLAKYGRVDISAGLVGVQMNAWPVPARRVQR